MPSAGKTVTILRYVAILAAACLTLVACDSAPGPVGIEPSADSRQVTVVGNGEVQGSPDTLTVNSSTEVTAPDATTAINQSSERQQAVIDALTRLGIDRKDISTTQVSLQPRYGADSIAIAGYQAQNTISVKIRDLTKASQALADIQTAGGNATRINSISYDIADDSQLVKDARARAFNDAKDRAQQYADLAGLKLGKVISISESTGTPPTPTPMQAPRLEAAAPVPLEPGQQTVSFSVTVIWELV